MKLIQKVILLFSVIVIVFGFYQLKHEQDIFAQSRARCCNNGQCNAASCISPSSIEAGSLCDTYLLTCKDCIDLEYSGCLTNCLNRANNYCDNNGTPYFGTTVSCLEQK